MGQLGDGRALIDLRALPDDKLTADEATVIVQELAGYQGRRVLLVDEAFLVALRETSVFMEFMELAATLYLLRGYALEVRPFMIVD